MTTPTPDTILLGADPITPAASADQRALLEWAAANPIDSPHPGMTKDGSRYSAPHPTGADERNARTRVTTFAGALDDTEGLTRWRHRLLARGALAEGLDALAAELEHEDDVRKVDAWVGRCLHAAGEKLAADVGTALHLAVEHRIAAHGTGTKALCPPAPWDADVDAFAAMMAAHQLRPVLSEAVLFVPVGDGLCGTADIFVAGPWGDELRVVDLKTGSSSDRIAYAVQLACYVRATHRWTAEGWAPMPAIDPTTAYIAHLPAGSGRCELVAVDIAKAAPLVDLASSVRNARRKAEVAGLFSAVEVPPSLFDEAATLANDLTAVGWAETPAEAAAKVGAMLAEPDKPAPVDASDWLLERIRAVAAIPAAKSTLARHWPDGVANKAPWPDVTHQQALDAVLSSIEAAHGIVCEFPPAGSAFTQPTPPPPTLPEPVVVDEPRNWPINECGTRADCDPDLCDAVRTRFAALPDDRKALAAAWALEGRQGKRPWAVGADNLTPRLVAVHLAIVDALASMWDGDAATSDECVRAALSIVIGTDLQPAWSTGAVLGSLKINQAHRLGEMAVAFGIDDHTATEVGAKVLALQAS